MKASDNSKLKSKMIYGPRITRKRVPQTNILRIEICSEYTRIDFVHYAYGALTNGGWMTLSPDCYLQPTDTSLKLKLVEAINIPLYPNRYHYKNAKEEVYYTLYFEPIPKGTKSLNIIDSNKNMNGELNFYGVSLLKPKTSYRFGLN